MADSSSSPHPAGAGDSSAGLTMTFLGCGNMGIAILSGILSSLQSPSSSASPAAGGDDDDSTPSRLPSTFIACVRRAESAEKISKALGPLASRVRILRGENAAAVRQADVVLLGCKPWMVADVLCEPGMVDALGGKLLLSICAGVTVEQVEKTLYGASRGTARPEPCRVVRVMPNTPSMVREGMTVVGTTTPPLDPEALRLVTWIFRRVGDVVHLPPAALDACTSLSGSGPAFFALALEGAIDGAVAMGVPRAEAQRMAAQTMLGAAALVRAGEHPTLLREKVSTPGGCTIGGLLVLEDAGVRGSMARAVREATVVASQLGQGVKNVNGTRHH